MTDQATPQGLSVGAWQQESLEIDSALERLQQRVSEQEPRIQALVEEEGRFDRLRSDIASSPPGPLNRVPIVLVDDARRERGVTLRKGVLADIAPTLLELLGIEQPEAMTGRSLLLEP